MRVITLNVNGLRSADRRGLFPWLFRQGADVVCLQEIRMQDAQLTRRMQRPGSFQACYELGQRPGYSGVALYAKRAPDRLVRGLDWPAGDTEGRLLQADFGDLSIVSLYMPSGSSSPLRQVFKFRYMQRLRRWLAERRGDGREYLVCGDWNIAHREIDIENWRGNLHSSGFLPEERGWLERLLRSGWVDVHRALQPEERGGAYTWWSNRGQAWQNNVGWRIDLQLATAGISRRARAATVYKRKRFSDHAPLILDYEHEL